MEGILSSLSSVSGQVSANLFGNNHCTLFHHCSARNLKRKSSRRNRQTQVRLRNRRIEKKIGVDIFLQFSGISETNRVIVAVEPLLAIRAERRVMSAVQRAVMIDHRDERVARFRAGLRPAREVDVRCWISNESFVLYQMILMHTETRKSSISLLPDRTRSSLTV